MRSFLVIALVACVGFVVACEKSGNERVENSFNIPLHGCANNIFSDNGVRLCFDSVVADSRCPANAVCFWQGTAVCDFSFFTKGKAYPLRLSTVSLPGTFIKDTIVSGYKIEFVNLTPYPGLSPAPPPANEIKAEVKITRL